MKKINFLRSIDKRKRQIKTRKILKLLKLLKNLEKNILMEIENMDMVAITTMEDGKKWLMTLLIIIN